ncbi:hypothetical protein BOTCAL_0091g00090 [Botryotinia calthae]|uniref:NADP-dependent oxidoreductase domain-containing protein n=1 Tax=Botryotinia calthae TaxID=38488 RepID=A0A4Y8D9H6_9HELO|nr:hypothetical protein BOTCAL_0091g00090 [Botryotinia calthae]
MAKNTMKYTNLGESGLKVSRICVGCMTYGDRRGNFKPWAVEEAEALPILKACYDSGINFFDTANVYSNGTSEEILGAAIKKYALPRENIVVATKLCAPVGKRKEEGWENALQMTPDDRDANGYVNAYGLSRKHIFDSVDASLKRLDLEYIDLLQIHRFDPRTPIKETMKALHDVVESGKVRYIGASSMEEEREMVPSLKKFGMGMIPWSPIMMGYLARPHEHAAESDRGKSMNGKFIGNELTEADLKINEKIQEIAKKRGVSMAIVAMAWSLSKEYVTAPIVGMGKIERVQEAVDAVNFELTKEEETSIDELYQPRKIIGFS